MSRHQIRAMDHRKRGELIALWNDPEKKYHTREIANTLGLDAGMVVVEIRDLKRHGKIPFEQPYQPKDLFMQNPPKAVNSFQEIDRLPLESHRPNGAYTAPGGEEDSRKPLPTNNDLAIMAVLKDIAGSLSIIAESVMEMKDKKDADNATAPIHKIERGTEPNNCLNIYELFDSEADAIEFMDHNIRMFRAIRKKTFSSYDITDLVRAEKGLPESTYITAKPLMTESNMKLFRVRPISNPRYDRDSGRKISVRSWEVLP